MHSLSLAVSTPPSVHPYTSIMVLILVAVGFVTVTLILTHLIGPKRRGRVKDDTYESGMPVIGDARRRFNVRFYVVAMMFLLFDVEIVFLWPWALVFYDAAVHGTVIEAGDAILGAGFLLAAMGLFFLLLAVGFLYDLRKGIFRWT